MSAIEYGNRCGAQLTPSSPIMSHVISLTLFDFVSDGASEIEKRGGDLPRVRGDANLVLLCENFLAQFSTNYLGTININGFDPTGRAEITRHRRALEAKANTKAAQVLILQLEPLFTLNAPNCPTVHRTRRAIGSTHVLIPELLSSISESFKRMLRPRRSARCSGDRRQDLFGCLGAMN